MALAGIPPWLAPQDFVGSARSGAQLGLQRRGQDIERQEAASRLQLAYDQLAAQEQRQSEIAQNRLQLAEMALEQKRAQVESAMAFREQGLAAKTAQDQLMATMRARELENAAQKLQFEQERKNLPITIQDVGGVKVLSGGGATPHAVPQTALPTDQAAGPLQAQPIIGPDGNALENWFATPSATGRGYTVHMSRPAAELTVPQATKALKEVRDLMDDYPSVTNAIPALVAAINKGKQAAAGPSAKMWTDASGKKYRYTGTGDPYKDRNPLHWEVVE